MNVADNAPHLTPETPDGYRPSVPKTTISQPQHIDKKFDTDVVSEAINDTSFRRHLSKENISIRQYAKEHGMTNAEAITKLYNDAKDKNIIRNVKTPEGAEKELLGDEPARILTRRPEQKDPGGKIKSMWDTIVRHWVDDTHEISRFAKKADDDMIRPLLDRAKTSIQSSNEMVNGDRQMLILKDGVVDNGKSLKGILRPVMDRGEQYEKDFSEFLYHRMNASYRHHVGSDVFGAGMTAEKSGSVVRKCSQTSREGISGPTCFARGTHGILQGRKTDPRFILFELIYNCGCRPSEAMEVTSDDIRPHEDLHVLHIRATKNKYSDRLVPIPDDFYERLKDYHGIIASRANGTKHTRTSYRRLTERLYREMNIAMGSRMYRNSIVEPKLSPDFVPYCLRHSYCTNLARSGVDVRVAQKLMGHSDIQTTVNIYAHIDESFLADAMDSIRGCHTGCHT